MTDEYLMSAAERSAYANGFEAHQRNVEVLLGKAFSSMSADEYLLFLRDVMIRLDASPLCIDKLDEVRGTIRKLQREVMDLKDELWEYIVD